MGDTETEYHSEDDESSDEAAFSFDDLPSKGHVKAPQPVIQKPPTPPPPTKDLTKQITNYRQTQDRVGETEEDEGDDDVISVAADSEPEPEPAPAPVTAPKRSPAVLTKAPSKPIPQQPPTPQPQPQQQPLSPSSQNVNSYNSIQSDNSPQPKQVASLSTPEPSSYSDQQKIPRRSMSASRPKLTIDELKNKIFMVASGGTGQAARISDVVVAIRTSGYVRDLKQCSELSEEEGSFLMFSNTLSIDDPQRISYSEFIGMEIFSDKEPDEEDETADTTSSSSTPPARLKARVTTPAKGSIRSPRSKTTPSGGRKLGPPRVASLAKSSAKPSHRTVTSVGAIRTAQSEAKKRALRMMRRTEQEATKRIEDIQKREQRISAMRRSTSSQINEKLANYERAVSASIRPERSLSPTGTQRVLLSPQPDVETDTFLSLLQDRLSPPTVSSLETPLSGATTEVICLQTFISQQRDTIQSLEDKLLSTDSTIRKLEKREQKALKRERRAVAQQTHLENKLLQMSNPEVLRRLLGKQDNLNGSINSDRDSAQLETPVKQLSVSISQVEASPQSSVLLPTPQAEQVTVHVPTGITEEDVKQQISAAVKPLKEKISALKAHHSEKESKLSTQLQDLKSTSDAAVKTANEQSEELLSRTKRIKELETHIKVQHQKLSETETELRKRIPIVAERDAAVADAEKLKATLADIESKYPIFSSCSVCKETGNKLEKRKSGALKCKKCIGKQRKK